MNATDNYKIKVKVILNTVTFDLVISRNQLKHLKNQWVSSEPVLLIYNYEDSGTKVMFLPKDIQAVIVNNEQHSLPE